MRRLLTPALLWVARLCVALLCFAPMAARAGQDFTLVNRTGYPIQSIYVSELGSTEWGNDVMGQDTLFPGERLDISFDRDTRTCRWNVMVRYRDNTQAVWNNIDLCQIKRFALFWDRQTLDTVARAE